MVFTSVKIRGRSIRTHEESRFSIRVSRFVLTLSDKNCLVNVVDDVSNTGVGPSRRLRRRGHVVQDLADRPRRLHVAQGDRGQVRFVGFQTPKNNNNHDGGDET